MDSSQRARAVLSFVQAADAGSFAAAGRRLGITSAAVSKNVAGLERVLGVRLMNRTTRTLSLTREGAEFLLHARAALDSLESAFEAVSAGRDVLKGSIRISTSAAFGHGHLMPVLPALLARHPGLAVEVDFDDRVVDLVGEGYDLALRGGHIPDSSLISRPVCRLNLALVASPAYLEQAGSPVSPDDLARHRLLARRFLGGQVAPWSFRHADGGIATVDAGARAALTLSAPEALVEAACAGAGIAQVGVHLAWPHLLAGRLKVVLQAFHDPGNYAMVIQYPHRALMAPRVRAVLEFLLEAFAQDAALHVPLEALKPFAA